jgi:hypothetical protein
MAGQYTLQQLQQMGLIGQDTLDPMFAGLFGLNGLGSGYSNQNTGAPAWASEDSRVMGESGVPGAYLSGIGSGFSQDAYDKANGYTFDWAKTGPRGAGTLTAFDPTGQQAGQYQQQSDSTFWQSVLEAGALAAAGFGGVGLMGLGPLGGLLGGAGGAGAAAGGGGGAGALGGGVIEAGMADAAANLAAYGSSAFAPANVAATMAGIPALGAAGVGAASAIPYLTADAGAGLAEFGAGAFSPANVAATSAGIPTIGAGASAAPAVFNAAKDSQAANAAMQSAGIATGAATAPGGVNLGSLGGVMSAAGGGLLSGIGNALKDPTVIGGLLGQGAQLIGANKASDAIGSAADKSNELLRYMYDTTRNDNLPALNARNQALGQASGLLANPSSIAGDPGYQFQLDQGIKAYGNSGAAKGMRLSGQQAKALTQYGQDYAGTKLTESVNRLMAVASGGQAGAGTIANAGGQYANGAAANTQTAGNALSNLYMGTGTGIGNAINGLTAYGAKKNWWES